MKQIIKTLSVLILFFGLSQAFAQDLDIEIKGPGLHKMVVTHPDGTMQRYIINIPDGYDGSEAVPLILGLHYGFGGMREGDARPAPFWSEGFFSKIYQQAFKPLNAIFLAADSVGGNWATPANEKAVTTLLDSVLNAYNIDDSKTIVTGYSMGAFGAWHWASKYQERFAGMVTIAGMPADMNSFREEGKMLDTDWQIPLYIMHSHQDELIDIKPNIEYVKKLKDEGKDVTFHELYVLTHHQENLLPEPVGLVVPWINRVWEDNN